MLTFVKCQGAMSLLDPFNSLKTDFIRQTLKIVNLAWNDAFSALKVWYSNIIGRKATTLV